MSEGTFEGWAVLELMGHRKLSGKISEQAVGGGSMLRIDMYCGEEEKPTATQFYGVQSVYCLTPSTEELCRQYAAQCVPQPVARYELPAPCEPDNPIAARREDFDDVCANCGRHDCDDCEPESDADSVRSMSPKDRDKVMDRAARTVAKDYEDGGPLNLNAT
jgi:hypothetical protein